MATHFTCDRCGQPSRTPGSTLFESVVVDNYDHDPWFSNHKATLDVRVTINSVKEDEPDLCRPCRVEIVRLALAALEVG